MRIGKVRFLRDQDFALQNSCLILTGVVEFHQIPVRLLEMIGDLGVQGVTYAENQYDPKADSG